MLLETGLPAARLELELTESTIMKDRARSVHTLRQIRALGVTIPLDDFGTGDSSLETLRAFPFDKTKLDRSFIILKVLHVRDRDEFVGQGDHPRSDGAEQEPRYPRSGRRIETEGQLSILDREGCHEAQGYLLGRPACLEQIVGSGQLSLIEAHPVDDAAGWRRSAENPTPGHFMRSA